MSGPDPKRLLEQARHLANRERLRPRQVSLRRAVSTAYYALFHLLIRDATRLLARASDARLRLLIPRAFKHEEMGAACRTFASRGDMPAIIRSVYGAHAVPADLIQVAQAFVDLQKARHDADYGTTRYWTRTEAVTEIERADQAFEAWSRIRPRTGAAGQLPADREMVRLFLAWLVLSKNLHGRA